MSSPDIRTAVKQQAIHRIVDDGNTLQMLIGQLDLQLSTEQDIFVPETLAFIESTLAQLDADCASLQTVVNFES